MSYWYVDGKDGRHYCWSKQPTFVCPLADPVVYVKHEDGESGHHELRDDAIEIQAGAALLKIDPVKFGRIMRSAHQRVSSVRERDDAGKLTDRCAACGHQLDRLGFRAWIEREPTAEEADTASNRINSRLFGAGPRWLTVESFYCETKKEAQAWARDEAAVER